MKGNGHPTNNQNISEYVALLYQKYSHKLYCNAFHYTWEYPKVCVNLQTDVR